MRNRGHKFKLVMAVSDRRMVVLIIVSVSLRTSLPYAVEVGQSITADNNTMYYDFSQYIDQNLHSKKMINCTTRAVVPIMRVILREGRIDVALIAIHG